MKEATTEPSSPLPTRLVSRRLIFFIATTAMMMSSLDQTIVSTALASLHRSLDTSITWAGWTITIYQLGQVIAMPVAGKISDQFGRKKVFLGALVVFTLSSLACGLAPDIYVLIVFRFLQALGGGAFMPSATGFISDHFGDDRDRAIGMITSTVPIGSVLGPVIGGVIIEIWSWRGVFLVNIPVGIVVFVLATKFLPMSARKDAAAADYVGVGLLAAALLPMMFGIASLGTGSTGLASPQFCGPVLAALVFVYLSVRHAKRSDDPLIPLRLLRIRAFAVMNCINVMFGGCVLGFAALVPLYAEERYEFAPFQAGTLLTSRAVGMLAFAALSAYVMRRVGYRLPMMLGFALCAAGLLMLALTPVGLSTYLWLAIGATFMGVGGGIAAPATNNALYSQAPTEVASIAGIRGMFRQIGGITAISIMTAFAAHSSTPGVTLGYGFIGFAAMLGLVALPLVLLVPDRKGTW